MNLADLERLLESEGRPRDSYCLTGGLPDEAYCIEKPAFGKWRTYYSERGLRTDLTEFDTEEHACRSFYKTYSKQMC